MNKPHILLLYRALIPSVRLCGHCQLEYLAKYEKLEYRAENVMLVSAQTLQWADTVILGRLDNAYELALAKRLKQAGKQLFYIIDDDLLNVPQQCGSSTYYGQTEIRCCIQSLLALSDGLISPSPLLLKKYCGPSQRGIWIEEPAIEPIPYSRHDGRMIKIGFAGSVDRIDDLQDLLGEALHRLHKEYGSQIQFVFLGAIPEFAADLNALSVPYQDSYLTYRKELNSQAWDIGLAPMPDTPFHACKHYNKFCEYAAAGVAGVFSNVCPYTRIAERYSGAILCNNNLESWYAQIKSLIDDSEYRERQRQKVSQMANGPLRVSECAEDFFRSAGDIWTYRDRNKTPIHGIAFLRMKGYIARLKNLWKKYSFGIFPAAFRKLKAKLK